MLVARPDSSFPYVVTVTPLGPAVGGWRSDLALVLIVDPAKHAPHRSDLIALFRLSPAEARLAEGLMAGKRLADIADERGLHIATLRTQLRAVLRKTGAERQADLTRLLAGIGTASGHSHLDR
jgi:DNA-binding CsgD family transcriptional regulator